ncbi:MAG: hypothetical protein L0312_01170, partial [Acidobacteria bacterium]|nr:hypothetical protein [Acidobacteriota bacterium]
ADHVADSSSRDINNEAFWKRIHSAFVQAREMLEALAKEHLIELNAEDTKQAANEDRRARNKAKNHELSRSAMKYAEMAGEWLESQRPLLEEKEKLLNRRLGVALDSDSPAIEAAAIIHSLEVVQWYQHQIYVKLARALTRYPGDEDFEDPVQNDTHGSIKVALIGMERSIAAWVELHNQLPDPERKIVALLVHLNRLRQRTEALFPNARRFIRPGFDCR